VRHDPFCIFTHLLALLLCSGCLDAGEEALPAPSVWRATIPDLDADAQRRQQEVDRYIIDELYRGYSIVETTQTYSGDLIDWIDPATVPGSQIEAPPPPADLSTPPGIQLQPTELDQHPELRGPEGTIPMVRPRFARYVDGDSGHDSLDAYMKADAQLAAGVHRLFSGYHKTVGNTTVVGFFDQSINQIQAGTFSLLEMATYCGGPAPSSTAELVGIAVSKDLVNFNDAVQRLRVEFLTAGKSSMGPNKGGWDGKVAGFVPAAGRPYGPNIALAQSVIGGVQYESHFHIQNFGGNWWVAHNGNWLGYYPGWLFNLINFQGCEAQWYGEVYDPSPQDWTWTDMGSGYHASTGYAWASHVRNPHYVSNTIAYWLDAPSDMEPSVAACYTDSGLLFGASPWERYFYLGGPGGNALGCD
jgi:hypothetical protein